MLETKEPSPQTTRRQRTTASNPKNFNLGDPRSVRKAAGLNQGQFWTKYGVTQSGGSRYESGRAIPTGTARLMHLHLTGRISDEDLQFAANAVPMRRNED